MAAAQTLSLTHVVNNKVTGVGEKLKDVNDKIDIVIAGKPGLLAFIHPLLIARVSARRKGHEVGCSANLKQRR